VLTLSHVAGGHEESGVPRHSVVRPYSEAIEVPGSKDAFFGSGLNPASGDPQRFDKARQLRRGGDVSDKRTTGPNYSIGYLQALPRREHVED
jgi:hypothetical protein